MPRSIANQSSAFTALLRRTVVLPLALLSVLSLLFIGAILHLQHLNHSVDHTDRVIAQVNHAQRLFIDAETGLRGYLLNRRGEFLEPYRDAVPAVPTVLERLRGLVSDNASQQARVDRLLASWEAWRQMGDGRIAKSDQGASLTTEEALRGKTRMDAIRSLIDDFVAEEQELRAARVRAVEETQRGALVGTVALALLFGGLLAVLGRRQLLGVSERYEATLEEQQRQLAAIQREEWVSRGRAELADSVRGELDEVDVASRTLSALTRYAGAEVGVLYALGDGGDRLDREATFACAEGEGGPPASVRLGEGWVGQVAADGRPQHLADLPDAHVRVTSATGLSPPRHLLVAPLTASGRTAGVVELGFLADPGQRVLDYLRAAADVAGAAIRSARYRAHLRDLLQKTQGQAQELQTQQEELRVANEELQEQSRALQASQAQLESQREELQLTNSRLEEQAAALEEQRDELEDAQAGLVEKADQLARANQYKSEFLANMSHELRTPLNSSLILAKLLADNKEGNLTPEQVRFAETIHSAGNDLLELINDILDLSRIEAGKLDVRPEPVVLATVVEAMRRTFGPMAEGKGVRFSAELEPGAPQAVESDPQRLQQILKNLLSNAVKFTERGEVSLRVTASGPDRVAFVVRDTGIGIARDDLAMIFEAFRQVYGSTHRQYGGTGLGLTISRDLARRLGGDVFAESAPGQGSTFSLVLPVRAVAGLAARDGRSSREAAEAERAPRQSPAPSPPPADAPPRARVPERGGMEDDREGLAPGTRSLLVVEDDLRFARILLDLAHERRFRCLVATTGAEGYALARRFQPSAILLDVNLPDESGLAVLERLKRGSDTRHIPVHVLSVVDYTQRALEMGAVGYALKPVARDALAEAIGRLERTFEPRTKQVLVVEDAEAQRESLRHLLAADGVEIAPVGTAQEALELLRSRTFDCMVLDLGLPDMSGYELLERMSADGAFSFPPVIVYTGRSLSPEEEVQLRRYSRSVVIKGARSPERLLDEVSLFIHRVESSLPREQQRLLREARNREAALDGRRILLVEDDVRNIFALSSALEPKGAALEIARNGREALDVLARAADGGPAVDLVLMDLMMPVMDGLTAIREIRARDGWKKLPIIALTAKAMADDRERCLTAGANDYIAKPIDLDKLLSLVRVWMPR